MYNNIIQSPNFYRVGLYIRLSESDEGKSYESESESIINQRNLLIDYVKSNGFTLIDEYVEKVELANSAEAKPAFYSVKTLAEYIVKNRK